MAKHKQEDINISLNNNYLRVDDTVVNMLNVLSIKKFDKTRAETNKYTIGAAGLGRSDDMKSWQFLYASDDIKERDLIFDSICALLQQ